MKKEKNKIKDKDKKSEEGEKLSWRAAEYSYEEKSFIWYAILFISALAIAIFSFATRNFFFGIFIIVAGILVFVFARRKPDVYDFSIFEDEIAIGEKMRIPIIEVENFSVRKRSDSLDEIIIRRKTIVNAVLRLPADSKTADKAREILAKKIPEAEYEESIIDIISDRLGL